MGEHRPRLVASSQRLREPIANCDVRQDMEDVSKKVQCGSGLHSVWFIWNSPQVTIQYRIIMLAFLSVCLPVRDNI